MTKVMTKEDFIPKLERQLLEISPNTEIDWSCHKGSESSWSRQIVARDCDDPQNILKRIFDITNDEWSKHYKEATEGPGMEKDKILKLHSSALLALLCFHNVSKEHPLIIRHGNEEEEYVECRFEVQNEVFDNPSSIDVMLISKKGNILYLESKFTEYLTGDYPDIRMKYWDIYTSLLAELPGHKLQLVYPKKWEYGGKVFIGFTIQPASKAKDWTNLYLSGIKQSISHIIGICKGPVSKSVIISPDARLRYGTILYKFPKAYNQYKKFYGQTIGSITIDMLLKTELQKTPYIKNLDILPDIISYQELFNTNPDVLLPKVAKYYGLAGNHL